jgi:transketolase C-terminal domain/subunit
MGVKDRFGTSGPAKDLLDKFGLTSKYICKEII